MKRFAALCSLGAIFALAFAQPAAASPVRLNCTFDRNTGAAASQRTWTYDLEAHTVDGHRVGEKVPTFGSGYNQYFITDSLIGFSSNTGVRHVISLADGRYTAYGANGSVLWSGTCSAAQ